MSNPSIHLDPSSLQLAYVEAVDYNTGICSLSFFRVNDGTHNTVVTQPYAGRGWGMFFGVEPGTLCYITTTADDKVYILGYLPDPLFYREDIENVLTIDSVNEFAYPRPQSGEVVLQSKKNARFALNSLGDLSLEGPTGLRLTLDATTDTIVQESAQRHITCESYVVRAGVIKRDTRTETEKQDQPVVGSSSQFGFNVDPYSEIIGFDPTYKPDAAAINDTTLVGGDESGADSTAASDIKQSFSNLPKGLADLRLGDTGPFNYRTDSVNPPLAELTMTFYEFADSNVGLDQQKVSQAQRAAGKFDKNVLGRLVLGTQVNEAGKIRRFDYGFVDGQMGHGTMWNTPGKGVHESGQSTDDYFDITNTLLEPKAGLSNNTEWTADKLELTDVATMFDFTLRTRGANYKGEVEPEEKGGANWFIRVDKQGLTKLNIPAATTINNQEPWREGRSLLANFDGSAELTIGKQYCTGALGLNKISGLVERTAFVNMNNYPNYGRKDRSLTLDLEGNAEIKLGRDENAGQSLMLEADGSLSAFFGKELPIDTTNGTTAPLAALSGRPISTACLSPDRIDRSMTVRLLGNAELHVGADERKSQSLMMTTEGGNRLMMGADSRGRSLDIHTLGGLRVEVQAPMSDRGKYGGAKGFALEFDLTGNLHIYVDGAAEVHSTGDMRLQTDKNFFMEVAGDMNTHVAGNYNLTVEKNKNVVVNKNDSSTINGARNTKISKTDATTAGTSINLQGGKMVAMDAGMIHFNSGMTVPANPSSAAKPTKIFSRAPEVAPIAINLDYTNVVRQTRQAPLSVQLPTRKVLNESLEETLNRFSDPFENEGTV